MDEHTLKSFLDEKYLAFNRTGFIDDDPVSVPHRYAHKEDREVAAFLTATISWGNRVSILASAKKMLGPMGDSPYDYVMSGARWRGQGSVHRTFMHDDLRHFLGALRQLYTQPGGFERLMTEAMRGREDSAHAIAVLRNTFLSLPHATRVRKHLPDPEAGAAAKRVNMFLRWMVRRDQHGVDLGLWKGISTAALCIPLDVHSGNVARALGLLSRKANDWKAVRELDTALRAFDPHDPVKYDYALFGLGAIEKFA